VQSKGGRVRKRTTREMRAQRRTRKGGMIRKYTIQEVRAPTHTRKEVGLENTLPKS
jgi:hypothetical protein